MTSAVLGPAAPPYLHVMTYNVRRRMNALTWPPSDRWSVRRPRLEALLRQEHPTVLGAQEALPDQAAAIRDALGSSYRFIGHGRQPGPRGEACPVFYDDARLELRDWRQVALSDRPNEPGSISWGNVIPRVAVFARFRDRMTSREFTVVNTHLDVFSARARLRAAHELRARIGGQETPTMLLGDFNAGPTSAPWRALLDDGVLTDAWPAAEAHLSPEWGTYGGYRRPRRGKRIDAILVSPGVQVRRAAINAHRFHGGWPSDHLPVQALVTIPRAKETP
ncbi:endonuclease/exonuclease/phosphatase family protein [Microbacterium sp. W4I20]|uniref:endonuclease/exonuclease/phosphatase family protein n=1 Tax=Microbacterium sp. W4I20 TaxID=3042262 RepID=UPI00278897C4|nr:endonuclease/exonuclease/phosphatase family protein [Microbacterium sp. W4I20]MDQ0729007.1 endonuclease/exonuclease/phosphatase family metal-dependent hydrolase [Microbacterium sp. W4I20]